MSRSLRPKRGEKILLRKSVDEDYHSWFFEVAFQRFPYSTRKLYLIISHDMSEDLRLSEISNGCGSYICAVVQPWNMCGTCFMSTVDRKSPWNLRTSLPVVSLRYHCCVFMCSENKMSANFHSYFHSCLMFLFFFTLALLQNEILPCKFCIASPLFAELGKVE